MKQSIDSHVHLDLVCKDHPERIRWLRDHNCSVVSWAFDPGIATVRDLKVYLESQREILNHIRRQTGLACYFLTGIHPRNIPPGLHPDDVPELLTPIVDDPICLGIGEIGLEGTTRGEQGIFAAQLELASSLEGRRLRVGVHTPRRNKEVVTARTLELLKRFSSLKRRVVVDHCSFETLGPVLEAGHAAGVTLSPVKTSLAELARMVEVYPDALRCMMCNTDSGSEFYEDLIDAAGSRHLPESIKRSVLHDNAAEFFAI